MTTNARDTLRVAVVGAGVAGITAAHLLQRAHDVVLYEKNDYIGGHTHTVVIEKGPDRGTPIDTGFIVCNDRTYPLFMALLKELDVRLEKTDMSFSYSGGGRGLQYSSQRLFAQRSNLFRPDFWHFLIEIVLFNRKTQRRLQTGKLEDMTLGEYLKRERVSSRIIAEYLIPMAAAIWSTPDLKMM